MIVRQSPCGHQHPPSPPPPVSNRDWQAQAQAARVSRRRWGEARICIRRTKGSIQRDRDLQSPAQDRAEYGTRIRVPEFPDLRPIGAPFHWQVPEYSAGIGNWGPGVPRCRFRPNLETGIPAPFPGQIGKHGGNWNFGVYHQLCTSQVQSQPRPTGTGTLCLRAHRPGVVNGNRNCQ